jgi:hypothetical protein
MATLWLITVGEKVGAGYRRGGARVSTRIATLWSKALQGIRVLVKS